MCMNDRTSYELAEINSALEALRKHIAAAESEINSLKVRHDFRSMCACHLASREPGGLSRGALSEIAETSANLKRAQSRMDCLSAERLRLQKRRREILSARS